jgi:hypothetical protein
LDIEIHLPKDNQVISKSARSQDRLTHGFHILIARNYSENLREEVQKGMREKAEQGIYPSRPPLGYRNNKAERTIEIDPGKAPLARRMFELYESGNYSLSQLREVLRAEFGQRLAKGYLDSLLKNPSTQVRLSGRESFTRVLTSRSWNANNLTVFRMSSGDATNRNTGSMRLLFRGY